MAVSSASHAQLIQASWARCRNYGLEHQSVPDYGECCAASLSLPRCVLRCSLNLLKNIPRAIVTDSGTINFHKVIPSPIASDR